MSLVTTAGGWIFLALMVALAALVAAAIGYLYGLFARHLDDESAIRGSYVITVGPGCVVGVIAWVLGTAGMDGYGVVTNGIAILVAGLAAGGVGTAAITGVLRSNPVVAQTTDPSTARRQYARYLTVLFLFTFSVLAMIWPAIQHGLLTVLGIIPGLTLLFWAAEPFVIRLTSPVRRPTDTERDRLEDVLETTDLSVRAIRIVDSDIRFLAPWLSGSPVFRNLFISCTTVTAYNDAALTALLVARREQKRYYNRLLVRLSFIAPIELVLLGLFFDGFSLPLAAVLALALTLLEFSALRRLRYYTDDRAADTVGAAELAAAFEGVAVEGGITVKETPSRNWFSSTPSLSARIERLRAEAGTTAGGAGATSGGTASAE